MIEKEVFLDLDRLGRLGMVEAIWGEHKSCEQIIGILRDLEAASQVALVTRVSKEKAEILLRTFEEAEYHSQASCLTLGSSLGIDESLGKVLVVTAGTSDLNVAAEAFVSLNCHGVKAEMLMDVGVSGLQRLLGRLDKFKTARIVIVCAGMEGALPTIIAGLIPQPVIGLPVSVGYGVSMGGNAALQGMLASCAPGLLVVNIDNGYGAAMAALRIIKSRLISNT